MSMSNFSKLMRIRLVLSIFFIQLTLSKMKLYCLDVATQRDCQTVSGVSLRQRIYRLVMMLLTYGYSTFGHPPFWGVEEFQFLLKVFDARHVTEHDVEDWQNTIQKEHCPLRPQWWQHLRLTWNFHQKYFTRTLRSRPIVISNTHFLYFTNTLDATYVALVSFKGVMSY